MLPCGLFRQLTEQHGTYYGYVDHSAQVKKPPRKYVNLDDNFTCEAHQFGQADGDEGDEGDSVCFSLTSISCPIVTSHHHDSRPYELAHAIIVHFFSVRHRAT